jgi:hypothetical protein
VVVERPRASGILDAHDRIGWPSAQEIIEALAAQRDRVVPAHVYNLKSKRGTPRGYAALGHRKLADAMVEEARVARAGAERARAIQLATAAAQRSVTMKQRNVRTYAKGRLTNGWERGELITTSADLQPGDVLNHVSHQFQAENLIRVVLLPDGFSGHNLGRLFHYEYVDARTLARSDGDGMACWD